MTIKRFLLKYKATISYVVTIVLVNAMYSFLPFLRILGNQVSMADSVVGSIYIVRDFSQREIGHYVIVAMLIGASLSYVFASEQVAYASLSAFLVGETIDWLIFTFTKKPLSERLLWSSIISAPIDTYVFLLMINNLNWLEFSLMSVGKFLGVLVIWLLWRRSHSIMTRANTMQSEYPSVP